MRRMLGLVSMMMLELRIRRRVTLWRRELLCIRRSRSNSGSSRRLMIKISLRGRDIISVFVIRRRCNGQRTGLEIVTVAMVVAIFVRIKMASGGVVTRLREGIDMWTEVMRTRLMDGSGG
jgi:hypothetical protein